MKRIFEIEYPDELGEFWMNEDNLLACLEAYCKGVHFNVVDCTEQIDELVKLSDELSKDIMGLCGVL